MRTTKDYLIDDLREENARLRGLLREVCCTGFAFRDGDEAEVPDGWEDRRDAALREGDDPDTTNT